jgi:hypothetical protein
MISHQEQEDDEYTYTYIKQDLFNFSNSNKLKFPANLGWLL